MTVRSVVALLCHALSLGRGAYCTILLTVVRRSLWEVLSSLSRQCFQVADPVPCFSQASLWFQVFQAFIIKRIFYIDRAYVGSSSLAVKMVSYKLSEPVTSLPSSELKSHGLHIKLFSLLSSKGWQLGTCSIAFGRLHVIGVPWPGLWWPLGTVVIRMLRENLYLSEN